MPGVAGDCPVVTGATEYDEDALVTGGLFMDATYHLLMSANSDDVWRSLAGSRSRLLKFAAIQHRSLLHDDY